MATTLTIYQRALRSTVVRKAPMAVANLVLIVSLLVHMYGNLKMLVGYEAFDHYACWLKGASKDDSILYPIIPKGQFIQVFRAALLLAITPRIWLAVTLSVKTIKNRSNKCQVTKCQARVYTPRIMHWGGMITLVFVIFRLIQLIITPGILGGDSAKPRTMATVGFQQWWITVSYAFSTTPVCMYIRHNFWSTFAILGGNLSVSSHKRLNTIALVVSVVFYAEFMTMPLYTRFGILK